MKVKENIMSIIKYYNNLSYPMDRTYVQLDIIINMHKLAATNYNVKVYIMSIITYYNNLLYLMDHTMRHYHKYASMSSKKLR